MELIIGGLLLALALGLIVYVLLTQADDKAMVRNSLRREGLALALAPMPDTAPCFTRSTIL